MLEKFLKMETGYVLDFSDRTFGEFVEEAVGVDIHSERYTKQGKSKPTSYGPFGKLSRTI